MTAGAFFPLEVFRRQVKLAVRLHVPLVVHTRNAEVDTLQVLSDSLPPDHAVHFHAFAGSPRMLGTILESWSNAVVGISGVVTFPHAEDVSRVAQQCPLERMVLETDAPFLSEEPRMIPDIAARVAELRGVSTSSVLAVTSQNCERVYGLAPCV